MIRFAALCLAAAGAATASPAVAGAVVEEPGQRRMSRTLDSALSGVPLEPAAVRKALERAVDSAAAAGFPTARARVESAWWTDSGVVLRVKADPGGRYRWGQARDAGSTRLRPEVLARLGALPSGAPADPADMERARRRILSTGYVEEEEPPRAVERPRTSLLDMRTRLRDLPTSSVEGAFAWNQGGSLAGRFSIALRDMLGTARDLEFGISSGDAGTAARVAWKEPWIGPLDLELRAEGTLSQDTLARSLQGAVDAAWTSSDGSWILSAGLVAARRAEKAPADTSFGPDLDEWGTRATVSWASDPPSAWPVRSTSVRTRIEAVSASADTGSLRRLRASAHFDAFRPVGPAVARLGGDARGIWPLDASAGLSECLEPGGISGWRGWPEGSPRTPAWAWAVAELRIGTPRSGGVLAFAEPGVRALRKQNLSWRPVAGASWGAGAELVFPGWLVELSVAARNDTRDWTEALLQVRAVNRF